MHSAPRILAEVVRNAIVTVVVSECAFFEGEHTRLGRHFKKFCRFSRLHSSSSPPDFVPGFLAALSSGRCRIHAETLIRVRNRVRVRKGNLRVVSVAETC
jgi:hypothetical protein